MKINEDITPQPARGKLVKSGSAPPAMTLRPATYIQHKAAMNKSKTPQVITANPSRFKR